MVIKEFIAILLIGTSEVVVEVSSTLVVEGLVVEVSSNSVVDVVTADSESELVFEIYRKDENTTKIKIKLVIYLLFIIPKYLYSCS